MSEPQLDPFQKEEEVESIERSFLKYSDFVDHSHAHRMGKICSTSLPF